LVQIDATETRFTQRHERVLLDPGTPVSGLGIAHDLTWVADSLQIAGHDFVERLPFRTGGGLNSSQTADAQAAYESLMTLLPTFLAGTNFVMHAAGWLEGGLVSCYEKFIIDIELLRMLRVEFTPLEIDEASLAFGAHEEVGHGGHFLGAAHTMDRFRDCFYRPLLSSTSNYERWLKQGGKDATARASEICAKTLDMVVGAYGSEAGNLALKVLATGGVYVGGGIAPKILKKLEDGTFMKAFTDKGRLSQLLINMPVRIILESRAAQIGAAAYAEARAAEISGVSARAASMKV